MTPEQLKASILQYAIQGKLVEQRSEEGTAEELYEQIHEEKQKLIKEGRIKKEKPPMEITDDEIPFDIPESWKWVRVQDVAFLNSGSQYEELSEGIPYIKVADMNLEDNLYEIRTSSRYVSSDNNGIIPLNSIIFPKRGGAIATNKKRKVKDIEVYIDSNTMSMSIVHAPLFEYIFLWFTSVDLGKLQSGSSVPQINNKDINPLLIPLPPFEEQYRIVNRIEELLPFVERYAKAYEKLEIFNAKFPEEMKKSILQYAIHGKLVEQRSEEGNAENLYQQIQEERKKYKIKEISVEEIGEAPFDIPETWKWVHLQDIVKKTIKRGKSPKYSEESPIQVFAQKCNVKTGGINMQLALFLDPATIDKYPDEEYLCNGDIVINSTGGGTMGRVGVFHDTDRINDMQIVPDGHVTVIRACDAIDYKYLYYFIKHNQKYLETQGEGSTNQTELKPVTIASLVLPLPPLAEQHRIVEKIEELLPYCERLSKYKH